MKKTYVLDTNVLLSDPGSLYSFDDNDVVIPMIVLEELDKHKTRQDEVGSCARSINRALDALRTSGHGKLTTGIILPKGGKLTVMSLEADALLAMPLELQSLKNDNAIIATAYQLVRAGWPAILVSKDINVRIKCDAIGIESQDYKRMRASADGELYSGVEVVEITPEALEPMFSHGSDGSIPVSSVPLKNTYPNQIVVLKCNDNSTLTRIHKEGDNLVLRLITPLKEVFGLTPRNKEQKFSVDLLMDPKVKLVTLSGPAGTGKSLLAIAASLEQIATVGQRPLYERLIVMRPVMPVGRDIGFLPGTLAEKMDPWVAPIRDNMNFLFNAKKPPADKKTKQKGSAASISDEPYLQMLQEAGVIEVEAITFIRGRSIPNSILLVDEAQNLTMHELKTIITRVSEGTKIILTGDINQIDNSSLDIQTNGMTYAIERFKDSHLAGHVTLLKGERSELATYAAKVL